MSSGMTAILHIFFLMRILEPKLFVALVKALNQWLRCAFGNVLQLIPSEQFAKLSPLWFSFIPTVITFSNLPNDPVGSILENKTINNQHLLNFNMAHGNISTIYNIYNHHHYQRFNDVYRRRMLVCPWWDLDTASQLFTATVCQLVSHFGKTNKQKTVAD